MENLTNADYSEAAAAAERINTAFREIKDDLRDIRNIITEFRVSLAYMSGFMVGRFGLQSQEGTKEVIECTSTEQALQS